MRPPVRRSSLPMSQEKLIERRSELMAAGKTDWRISCMIAEEHGVGPKMVESRLAKLRKQGVIGENPNMQAKRGKGFDLTAFRSRLMEEGLCDGAIAKMASEESGRSVSSLKTSISKLVREGETGCNPNNQVDAEPKEVRWIWRRREELAALGLSDTSISRIVARESGIRNEEAVRRIIWGLVRDKLLKKNRNKGNGEMEWIILSRYMMIERGMDEREIAYEMSKEKGCLPQTMGLLIYRAVRIGGCRANHN